MTESISELYLFGSGPQATVALSELESAHGSISLTIVSNDLENLSSALRSKENLNVMTQQEFENSKVPKSESYFHVAIGSNLIRYKVAKNAKEKGLMPLSVISNSAVISPLAVLGSGVFVGPNSHVGPGASLGDFSILNTHANVEHDSKVGNFSHLAPGSCICGNSELGEGAFIGANAVVREGCSLGPWSTLGALSFLNFKHEDEGITLLGAPARAIGKDLG